MKKITIVYWSGTGNTEMMAKAISEGAQDAGAEVKLLSVDKATVADIENADGIALGCPSMGIEVLEESEMEPFIESIENAVTGKPTVLFGSYDWGNGEWMDDWAKRMENYGADLVNEGLIVQLEPTEASLKSCKELGVKLAG